MFGSKRRLTLGAITFFAAVSAAVLAPENAWAEPNGWYGAAILCADTVNFDCVTIGATTVEKEVKTRRGTQTVEKREAPTWEDMWPDEGQREIIQKINRMNYRLREGYQIAVPKNLEGSTLMDFSPFPEKAKYARGKHVVFDPGLLAFAAYDSGGNLVRWGPAAGGKNYCGDIRRRCRTPVGTFKVYKEYGASYRSGKYPIGCRGKSCARMPYAMFFRSGYAIHAGYLPGKNASHGCIRVFYDDAQWLNREFVTRGTTVIVRPYPRG